MVTRYENEIIWKQIFLQVTSSRLSEMSTALIGDIIKEISTAFDVISWEIIFLETVWILQVLVYTFRSTIFSNFF